MIRNLAQLVLLALMISGCATNVAHQSHQNFDPSVVEKGQILIVEPDVTVSELGVAGAEEVPEWSEQALNFINQYLDEYLATNTGWQTNRQADLNPATDAELQEYIALYKIVAGQYINSLSMPGWKQGRPNQIFTLGPGISFIKEKTGLDMALFTVAEDYVSSGGLIMTQIVLAAAGVGVPGGHSIIHVGVIDLESGDIKWTNTAFSTSYDLKSDKGSKAMLEQALSKLPKQTPKTNKQ